MTNAYRRILVYRLGSLGDTILALPTLAHVRRTCPTANITLLTNIPVSSKAAPVASILDGAGVIDDTMSYPVATRDRGELFALHRAIRRKRFDLVVHLTAARGMINSVRDAFFFRSAGIPRIIGIPWRHCDRECLPLASQPDCYEWEAARLARRVRALGAVNLSDVSLWDLRLSSGEKQSATDLLRKHGITGEFLAVGVGTKVEANHWTASNWNQLISLLAASAPAGAGLVMLGTEGEYGEAEDCLRCWKGPKANLCGQTTPRQAAAILQRALQYVGHDSGILHLAAAVGTKCVGIYSARNPPGQWYPMGKEHIIFYRQTDCFGCRLDRCIEQKKKCILSISPEEVASASVKLLGWNPLPC